ARAAGALRAPRLLAAARDERAVLHRHRARAAVDGLHLRDLVEEVRIGLGPEDLVGELDLRDLLLLQIDDVELGHDVPQLLISTTTPADRSSFISASSVCCVGSRITISRLWVRI